MPKRGGAGRRSASAAGLKEPKPSAGTIEKKIASVYERFADRYIPWVGLATLRTELGSVSRPDVDKALLGLLTEGKIRLIPEENQKTITSADEAAAIMVSGAPKHLIAFQTKLRPGGK